MPTRHQGSLQGKKETTGSTQSQPCETSHTEVHVAVTYATCRNRHQNADLDAPPNVRDWGGGKADLARTCQDVR